ncbi:MAG: D-2-hydroxyacid dehydrogenase [Anaerolineae bacterium]
MEKVKVLSVHHFSEEQLDKLRAVSPRLVVEQRTVHNDQELEEVLDDEVEVLFTFFASFDPALAPRLRWIQLNSAGVDHILDAPIMESDVIITTASGIHAPPIAEYVLAFMLSHIRKFPQMLRYQMRREWPKKRWKVLLGGELRGKTVGIVGYGSIGREVGRLAKAFGMRVVATKRSAGERGDTGYWIAGAGDPEASLLDRLYPPEGLQEMLAECDFVVIAVPSTSETMRAIGEEELRAMKPSSFLVNIARGEIIDEPILIRALKEGWISGAGLDVFAQEPLPKDSELWDMENVIISPHIAAATPCYDERATDLFAENLRRYLAGEELLNVVDRKRGY